MSNWNWGADLKKAEEIFRRREAIYYSDSKKAKPEVVKNWRHLVKVFPAGALTQNLIQIDLREEREIIWKFKKLNMFYFKEIRLKVI